MFKYHVIWTGSQFFELSPATTPWDALGGGYLGSAYPMCVAATWAETAGLWVALGGCRGQIPPWAPASGSSGSALYPDGCWQANHWVPGGVPSIITSPDGNSWTTRANAGDALYEAARAFLGVFWTDVVGTDPIIAVGYGVDEEGKFSIVNVYSTDGITWDLGTLGTLGGSPPQSHSYDNIRVLSFGDGWVIYGPGNAADDYRAWTSSDGINFAIQGNLWDSTYGFPLSGTFATNGSEVMVVYGGAVKLSSDGYTFTYSGTIPPPDVEGLAAYSITSACWDATNNVWVVVGSYTTSGPGDLNPIAWTSPDGITWTQRSISNPYSQPYVVRYVDGVGTGESGPVTAIGGWYYDPFTPADVYTLLMISDSATSWNLESPLTGENLVATGNNFIDTIEFGGPDGDQWLVGGIIGYVLGAQFGGVQGWTLGSIRMTG